jgi:hypothetical protein
LYVVDSVVLVVTPSLPFWKTSLTPMLSDSALLVSSL